jgi:hypothetical protein
MLGAFAKELRERGSCDFLSEGKGVNESEDLRSIGKKVQTGVDRVNKKSARNGPAERRSYLYISDMIL